MSKSLVTHWDSLAAAISKRGLAEIASDEHLEPEIRALLTLVSRLDIGAGAEALDALSRLKGPRGREARVRAGRRYSLKPADVTPQDVAAEVEP